MGSHHNTETRAKLLDRFSEAKSLDEYNSLWDVLWKEKFRPWDNGSPNPALIDLLEEQNDLLIHFPASKSKKLKALVPGCGKGYDVMLLATYGYDTVGLEISETALTEAKDFEKTCQDTSVYQSKKNVTEKGAVKWLTGDFFDQKSLDIVGDNGKFDLIYDYTFLCALHPNMRPAWAKRMTELLTDEGRLVCIEFPTYKSHSSGGPPWALPSKVYEAHLKRPGRELLYHETEGLVEGALGDPDERCLHRIAHFQPKRTSAIAYDADGKVTDWIGIWAHSN